MSDERLSKQILRARRGREFASFTPPLAKSSTSEGYEPLAKASEDAISDYTQVTVIYGGMHSPVSVTSEVKHVGARANRVSAYEFYTVSRLPIREAEAIARAILAAVTAR